MKIRFGVIRAPCPVEKTTDVCWQLNESGLDFEQVTINGLDGVAIFCQENMGNFGNAVQICTAMLTKGYLSSLFIEMKDVDL